MPNTLDATGLTVKTRAELVAELEAAFKLIYGPDINLGQDTPDGQMLNIYVQGYLDLSDLLTQIYDSFDPDQAIGRVLDARVGINAIQRKGGTKTTTNVEVTVTEPLNLYGVDQTIEEVFVVEDDAGSKFELQVSQVLGAAGTYTLAFQAQEPGATLTVPNTITSAVTVVLGVSTINNPSTYTTLGVDEESDAELKLRRKKSVSLASQGALKGLYAELQNINGVSEVFIYENNTSLVDADGIPAHGIWVIVSGTATDQEIAEAIYKKRNLGVNMKGLKSYVITQVDATTFVIKWDASIAENIFLFAQVDPIDSAQELLVQEMRDGIVNTIHPKLGMSVNANTVSTALRDVDPNALVSNVKISNGRLLHVLFDAAPTSGIFNFSYGGTLSADVNWNDSAFVIQGKLNAMPEFNSALVSGSIAGQDLTVDLTYLDSVTDLLLIKNSTLDAVASVAFDGSNILDPKSKKYKFAIESAHNILTPILTVPSSITLNTLDTHTFNSFGGYGAIEYTLTASPSGGGVTLAGVYTAGGSLGLDVLEAKDELGNIQTVNISVV